ncbi:uncharacterized protein LOC120111338 [Phoenix dactylifera]|uniref:Uncharacterized protein LOC120111338 n=1 Tax=Phoenix dactylifera TaxID=42345 RepID=A0A8B9ACA3_PHODC|nr:uncharacterized protein LOC120111338 [Phoenix dactylifera]
MMFVIDDKISWIWKWVISTEVEEVNIPVLKRKCLYKWWLGMPRKKFDDIITTIKSNLISFKNDHAESQQTEESTDSYFASLKNKFSRKYPQCTSEEIISKCMDHMKQQLCSMFKAEPKKTVSMKSTASRSSSCSTPEDNNKYRCLAGESQDPYTEDTLSSEEKEQSILMHKTLAAEATEAMWQKVLITRPRKGAIKSQQIRFSPVKLHQSKGKEPTHHFD